MAPPANDDDRPGPTPVPPRGGKRRPNRPPAKKSAGGRPAVTRRPAGGARPADNRRVAMAAQRRRNQTGLVAGVIVVIIAVVGIFIGIKVSGNSGTKSKTATTAVSDSTLSSFTSAVSIQEMKAAAANYPLSSVANEGSTYPLVTSDTPITTGGKPDLLYLGAEYCPFCATERWPLVLALSKFGTFHHLSAIHSDGSDIYPDTPTFSFYKSTYTSPYLTFTPVETETVTRQTLQTPTKAEQTISTKYDASGDIPFVYFNGKAVIDGAEYSPSLLGSGYNGPPSKMTFQQIADSIAGGQSALASSVDADAGAITAAICRMTGGKPGNVCSLFPKPITS